MQLHWAPVYFRVEFKIILLTWRAFHRQAPGYIRGQLHPYVPGRSLRSYDQGLLMVPCTKAENKGRQSLLFSGAQTLEICSFGFDTGGLCGLL